MTTTVAQIGYRPVYLIKKNTQAESREDANCRNTSEKPMYAQILLYVPRAKLATTTDTGATIR